MMTATARKTWLENKHSRNCEYFAIIPSCSHFTMLAKNSTNGCSARSQNRYAIKDSQLGAQVVIKTVNMVISRCCFVGDSTDLFLNACRTYSTLIFPHCDSTNQILNLWRCRFRSLRWCESSLLDHRWHQNKSSNRSKLSTNRNAWRSFLYNAWWK